MPHCTACCSQSMMAGKEECHATSWCSGLRLKFSFGFDTIEMEPNKTAEINQTNEPFQLAIMLCFFKLILHCVYEETHFIRKAACDCAIFTQVKNIG